MEQEAQAPVIGTPEYDAAMASKFEGTAATESTPVEPAGEELILGKFKSADDLAAAYKELEAKIGQPKEDTQAGQEDTQDGQEDAAEAVVTDAGLDFDALSNEYALNGALSDDTYKSLEDAGIPKALVDQYIAGQHAIVEKLQLTAYATVGGEENYAAMVSWAAQNMSEAEIESFNTAVNATNPDIIKMAVMGLKGRYEASNGHEPDLMGGDLGAASGPAYESWAQVREAMKDPKYAKDPAYRRSVEQKLARSNPL